MMLMMKILNWLLFKYYKMIDQKYVKSITNNKVFINVNDESCVFDISLINICIFYKKNIL